MMWWAALSIMHNAIYSCLCDFSSCVFSRKRAAEDWRLTLELSGSKPFSKGSPSEVSNSGSSSHFSLPAPSIVNLGSPPSSTSWCFQYTWERNDSYLVYRFFCEHPGIGRTIEKRDWHSSQTDSQLPSLMQFSPSCAGVLPHRDYVRLIYLLFFWMLNFD